MPPDLKGFSIPDEQYDVQQSTAKDGSVDKILKSDISHQRRLLLCVISADVANCYDRIHHTIIVLLFLALGVNTGSIAAMLQYIQMMKFFLYPLCAGLEAHSSIEIASGKICC